MTQIQEKKLPEGWIETTLGEVLEKKGYIRGPFGSSLKRGEMKESGIPVYEQQNAIYNHRNFRFFIDEEKYFEMKRFTVKENDILISCSGTIGKTTIIKKNDPSGIISQALLLLRCDNSKIDVKLLNYYLNSREGQYKIIGVSHGSVQVNIAKREDVENISLSLPPLPEQQAIAKILSSFDDKIELLREQNETLEKIGQEIFKEWFGKYKVGDELPEGWKVGKLGNLIHFIVDNRGKTPVTVEVNNVDFIPLIEINALIGKGRCVNVDLAKKGVTNEVYNTWFRKGHPERGDILFSTVGSIGEIALVFDEKICIAQNIVSLRPKVGGEFLFELLNYIKPNLLGLDISTVQPSIKLPHLLDYEIIIPEKILINDFIGKTRNISEKIFQNTLQIQTLSKTRDELLPKLIKGKVRVV